MFFLLFLQYNLQAAIVERLRALTGNGQYHASFMWMVDGLLQTYSSAISLFHCTMKLTRVAWLPAVFFSIRRLWIGKWLSRLLAIVAIALSFYLTTEKIWFQQLSSALRCCSVRSMRFIWRLFLGMTLNCTKLSCFNFVVWITVDSCKRYQPTNILVSLSFGLADDHFGNGNCSNMETADLELDNF